MNIWIFNHYAHPPDVPGGTRHYDLGRELVKRGDKVLIFASSYHHYLHRETRLKKGERWRMEDVDGVTFAWLHTFPYRGNDWRRVLNMLSYMIRAWRLGRKLPQLVPKIAKPDVVLGSSVHLLAVLAAHRVARCHNAKFIMEVRDLWPQTIIDMGALNKRSSLAKLLQALERFLYRRAERIITLPPLAHQYLTACGVSKEKIVWIPNGVDLSRFNESEARNTHGPGFKVRYLGAHGQANALDVLLEAARIIHDQMHGEIEFVLVGDGPQKPRLIESARQMELKNVEFRNPVPKNEVSKVLQEADAFVLNLERAQVFRYAISPNKLFDYMAAGRPVIFSVGTPENPVEEAQCGLTVPPRDPQALAKAVIQISQMPKEERVAMGQRGREYVEKYHAIPVLAERLIQCIESA
jgi:glycosyltransferase involved in cell wall biosynthesis